MKKTELPYPDVSFFLSDASGSSLLCSRHQHTEHMHVRTHARTLRSSMMLQQHTHSWELKIASQLPGASELASIADSSNGQDLCYIILQLAAGAGARAEAIGIATMHRQHIWRGLPWQELRHKLQLYAPTTQLWLRPITTITAYAIFVASILLCAIAREVTYVRTRTYVGCMHTFNVRPKSSQVLVALKLPLLMKKYILVRINMFTNLCLFPPKV